MNDQRLMAVISSSELGFQSSSFLLYEVINGYTQFANCSSKYGVLDKFDHTCTHADFNEKFFYLAGCDYK